MSRKYPTFRECPECGNEVPAQRTGEIRGHACVRAPWPTYTQPRAAKMLGTDAGVIDGWANNPLPAVKIPGATNNRKRWLFQQEAVDAVIARLSDSEPEPPTL